MNSQELWRLRVGLSYALSALCREIGLGETIHAVDKLRHDPNTRLSANQPPSVRDRFAFFCQTARLTRDEVEELRATTFEGAQDGKD